MASIRDLARPVTDIRPWRNLAIYGQPKSGKTVFAAQFPEPIHFDCDPGLGTISLQNHKSLRENLVIPCRRQEGGIAIITKHVESLMRNQEGFETVIIDTISELVNWELMLYRKANDKKLGYDPRQTYGNVQERFYPLLMLLVDLPMNVILLCHQREDEDQSTGAKILVTRPSLPPGIAALVNAAVDMTGYLDLIPGSGIKPEERELRVKAKSNIQAGTRLAFESATIKNPTAKHILTRFVPADMVGTPTQEVASAT